jgi:hypothetical protein
MVVLQRVPVLRAAIAWESVASVRTVSILQGALVGAFSMSEVHAQAGATTLSPAPGQVGNPGRGVVGEPFRAAIAIVGAPVVAASYQVTGTLPEGLVIEGLNNTIFNGAAVPITGTPIEAGTFTVFIAGWNMPNLQGEGGNTVFDFNIEIEPASTVNLQLVRSPDSIETVVGATAVFTAEATADAAVTYQWYRHRSGETGPQALAGETSARLTVVNVAASDMGFYFVRITSGDESLDSEVAILTITGGASRLANLSTRGSVPAGGELTPGFVLRGDGNKQLVIRAVGPELADFGVTTAMADPALALVPMGGTTPSLTNDNWEDAPNASQLASVSATLGAFPLDSGSRDAAVLNTVSLPNAAGSKGFTVQITSASDTAGIALAEVYDPGGTGGSAQLTNISARGFSGVGAEVLAPGFVIEGDGAKTMLIRVVGPTLGGFGVPGAMIDPRLEVIPGGQTFTIARNDNWGGTAALKAAFQTTGAFAFAEDASLDAAVVVRLPPGAYTVRPTGANNGTGVILVEAYEVLEQ